LQQCKNWNQYTDDKLTSVSFFTHGYKNSIQLIIYLMQFLHDVLNVCTYFLQTILEKYNSIIM
jgi:hypothetical protein